MERYSMKARTVLITGASKGIGREVSDRLAAGGHHVVGFARHADPTFPGELITVDLSDAEATQATLDELAQRRHIDGSCTAVSMIGSLELMPNAAATSF
jgi:short-subunit dehydrogenase